MINSMGLLKILNLPRYTTNSGITQMKFFIRIFLFLILAITFTTFAVSSDNKTAILFEDDFSALRPGMISSGVVGAHAEYHYIPETAPRGNWAVSCFSSNQSQRAWRVLIENGEHVMYQSYSPSKKERIHTHPMIVAGDELWQDYTFSIEFAPTSDEAQSGVIFRYKNDRCYYFFGVNGSSALLKKVNHADSYRTLKEKILDEKNYSVKPGDYVRAEITVKGDHIKATLNGKMSVEAIDSTFSKGKIGLTSDIPTRFKNIRVTSSIEEKNRFQFEKTRNHHQTQPALFSLRLPRVHLF